MAKRKPKPQPRPIAPPTKWIALAIAVVTVIVYWRAKSFGFVPYDDNDYVYENPMVLGGLTLEGLRWAFAGFHFANWFPLTWISHMLDVSLVGPDAGGQHVMAFVIHAVSSAILFVALLRLSGAAWPSAIVASLFALHPLHVESVAWLAERKDVLSGLFWNLSLLIYARYVRGRSPAAYRWLLVVFALALLSKQMVVTLPFVLLLIDWWPLRRPIAWLEKLPLMAMSAIFSVVIFLAQKGGPMATFTETPLSTRLQNATLSYLRYLGEMFWPASLAVFYPYPKSMSAALVFGAAIVIVAITIAAWSLRSKAPYVLVGWLWYLGTLVPVIGVVQVGQQSHADRYTYLPSIGIFIAVVWGVYELTAAKPTLLRAAGAAAAALLLILAAVTWHQLGYWRDGEALFGHAIAVNDSPTAESNLGMALNAQSRSAEAIPHFQRAVAMDPHYVNGWVNLGNALARNNRVDEAIVAWQSALSRDPTLPDVRNNLGVAYMRSRNFPQAIEQFKAALATDPRFVPALLSLARVATESGDAAAARGYYTRVLEIDPGNDEARRAVTSGT